MKKVFLMTLAILVILLSLSAVAMADTLPTVYVGGTGAADTNDGLTEGTAVATFAQAYTALGGNGGTIIVCGDMSITSHTTFPDHEGMVTITGKEGASVKINTAGSLDIEFVGETVIQNITFNHTAGSGCTDFYPGKSLTFGEGVTMKNKGSAYTSGNLFVVRMGSQTSKLSDSTFNMASGTLNMIAGGEDYGVANSDINISGGSVLTSVAAGGLGGKTIDYASVTVSGGTVTTVNISGGADPLALGGCEITISGGTVGGVGGVSASSTSGTLSKVDITLDGTSVGSGGIDLTSLTGKSGVSITDGPNLTVKKAEYISLGNSLSEFKSLSLEDATLEITGTYAGPSSVSVDAGSTLILPEGTTLPTNTAASGGSVVENTPLEKVYLDGTKTSSGHGNTPENAVNTLGAAFDKLSDNGGTIVVCGNLKLDMSALTTTKDTDGIKVYDFPARTGTVTITGKDGQTNYAPVIELMDSGKWHMQCNSPMVFEHLTFNRTADRCVEFFTGKSLTFGEGIVCQYNGGEIPQNSSGYIAVRLGYCYNKGAKPCESAEFIMKSGTLSFIQGGSGRNAVTKSTITLYPGTKIVDILQCGGANQDVGTSTVSIDGAAINNFYINGWSDANLGGSTITIKDSDITYLSDHRTDASSTVTTAKINGNVSLTLENTKISSMAMGNIPREDDVAFSLTLKKMTDTVIKGGLEDWDSITMEDSTVYVTKTYAGPDTITADAGSVLTLNASRNTEADKPAVNGQGKVVLDTVYEGPYVEKLLLSKTAVVPAGTRSGANQGTAIYGDYVVQCHDNGYVNIYDLTSDTPGTPIAAFKLGSYNDGSAAMRPAGEQWDATFYRNHANQAMFGPEKFDESDPFPLLYVTTGKKGWKMEDGSYIAKCAVERIRYDETNGWYSQLVQTIEFNDAGYTDLGSGRDGTVTLKDGKFTYSGTSTWTNSEGYQVPCWGWPASFVDSSPTTDTAGKFYIHSARFCTADSAIGQTATHNYATGVGNGNDLQTGVKIENFDNYEHNAYIITEFTLPALPESEADFGKTVTLTPEDITDQFTTEYDIWVTQGGTMYQGRIYYPFGFGTQSEISRNGIRVYDIALEECIGKIDLYKDSQMKAVEPEGCAIYKGHLALGYVSTSNNLWVFDYIESIEMPLTAGTCTAEATSHTFDCLTNRTLRTFTGEKDAANHAGGTEVRAAVTETCTTPGYTGDTYCLGCGGKLQTGTEISARNHSFTTYTSDGNAACEADGTETAKCDHAGCTGTDTRTDAGSKLGHKLTKVDAKAATYDAAGNIEHYTCTACGKLYADETAAKELAQADVTIAKLEAPAGESTTQPTEKPANTSPATGDVGIFGAVAWMACSMLGMAGIAVSTAKKKED